MQLSRYVQTFTPMFIHAESDFLCPILGQKCQIFLHLPLKNPKFSTTPKIIDKIILKKNQNNFVGPKLLLYLYNETFKNITR